MSRGLAILLAATFLFMFGGTMALDALELGNIWTHAAWVFAVIVVFVLITRSRH